MGLFFSHDKQTGGFQSENVHWEPDLIPVQEMGPSPPPSPSNLDQLALPKRVETPSEDLWTDPVVIRE